MNQQLAGLLITTSEVAIIDVDVVIARFQQTRLLHGPSLLLNDLFTDVKCKRVPRAPTHCGKVLRYHTPCTQHGQCHDYGIPYHFMLHSSYPCLFHLYH